MTMAYDMDPNLQPSAVPPASETAKNETAKTFFWDAFGGTGASVSGSGNSTVDKELIQRMRNQDRAVMMLLFVAYMASLLFSICIAYRQVHNRSSVVYYADPRYHAMTTDNEDIESFLE